MHSNMKGKNVQYIKALNKAYLNHQLVIFYGAGLSKPLGLPDWRELIQSILGQFVDEENITQRDKILLTMESMDFWKGMDYIQQELDISDQDLKDTITLIISESEQLNCPSDQQWEDNNYEDFAKMDLGLFITTNYDKIFPKCLNGHCETIDFFKNERALSDQLSISGNDKKIIYLHGIVEDPSSIVISETDVKTVYNSESWSTAFSTVLNSSKVLFIGVSFCDPFLRDFVKERTKVNNNSFYALVLNEMDEILFSGNQILVDNSNPVKSIRDILERIGREIENIIIIRIPRLSQEYESSIKEVLYKKLSIFSDIKFTYVDPYEFISFSTFKKNQSLMDVCIHIKEAMEELLNNKIIPDNHFVCFVSQNLQKAGRRTGTLQAAYMKEQTIFLSKLISSDSYGFIIDKISLNLSNNKDKNWIQSFADKKGMIPEENKEYSVYSEDTIKIRDSYNSGTEVHVAGFVFYKGKLVLEKRNSSEANVPDKYSLPGGRLKKGEGFQDALKRILKEKYKITAEHMMIVDEFKVHDANIPGLAFGFHIKNIPDSFSYDFFDLKKLSKLQDNQLACDRKLIDKAFNLLNKKEKIKLRIIMLTDCVYNCRCCHHENIKETFNMCQIKKIENSLRILRGNFDIQQITITGGEPLLPKNRSNLLRLLRYIRSNWKKVDLSIITNAYYLNDKCISSLKPFNIRYKISLYGYNTSSFLEYTEFHDKQKKDFDYIADIECKIRDLYKVACNVTLNIPLNKKIEAGLGTLLSNSRFKKTIADCGAEIKIIEMVKPRCESTFFDEDFVQVVPAIDKMGAIEETNEEPEVFSNTRNYNITGTHVSVYKYPCENPENCKTCFNNFALTMKPDGQMLICRKALLHNHTAQRIFSDIDIMVEDVDLGKEYENFHI